MRAGEEIRIVDIALLPAYCNRGVGTTLLRGLQSEAAAAGKPLRIHVERFNPALRLYERLGFRPIEDKGVYLFMEWRGDDNSQRSNDPTIQGNAFEQNGCQATARS
jgi:Acetyltransferase (GNAT) domain